MGVDDASRSSLEVEPYKGTFCERLVQYVCLGGFVIALKVLRASIPSFVPIIGREFGYSEAERAILLSGFFQGYMCTQVPGAAIVQRYGAKGIMTFALCGTVALFSTMPYIGRRFGSFALMLQLTTLGLIQGPLAPGQSQITREWMPNGYERVWALRGLSLCHQSTDIIAAFITPRLCARGFGFACKALSSCVAAYTVFWQIAARSRPGPAPVAADSASTPNATMTQNLQQKEQQKETKDEKRQEKAVEWRIFRLSECQAMVCYWIACGNVYMNMAQWAPTYFQDAFNITAAEAGAYLAAANFLHIPGNFLSGVVESALISRFDTLLIRKGMTAFASLAMGLSAVFFGLANNARQATFAFCLFVMGQQANNCGIIPNFWELGGADAAVLNSVCNSLASFQGVIVAPIGVLLRRLSGGSWTTQYVVSALLLASSGLFYTTKLTLKPAREILKLRDNEARK